MQALMWFEPQEEMERRLADRQPSSSRAVVRRLKGPQEEVRLVDISCQGCGFVAKCPPPVGAKVWLNLPGLETWAATVMWCDEERGGLRFERNLHPLVAQRYASQADPGLRS